MNKLFALLVSFVLLAGMWIPTYATFEDVDTNNETLVEAVDLLAYMGVTKGISETEFGTEQPVTREQFTLFVYRLVKGGKDAPATSENVTKFTDLEDPTYFSAIAWANSKGIVKGASATSFDPKGNITLQDAYTMLVRTLGYEENEALSYPYGYIEVAESKNVKLDTNVKVNYTDVLTRGDMAILLYNTFFAETGIAETKQVEREIGTGNNTTWVLETVTEYPTFCEKYFDVIEVEYQAIATPNFVFNTDESTAELGYEAIEFKYVGNEKTKAPAQFYADAKDLRIKNADNYIMSYFKMYVTLDEDNNIDKILYAQPLMNKVTTDNIILESVKAEKPEDYYDNNSKNAPLLSGKVTFDGKVGYFYDAPYSYAKPNYVINSSEEDKYNARNAKNLKLIDITLNDEIYSFTVDNENINATNLIEKLALPYSNGVYEAIFYDVNGDNLFDYVFYMPYKAYFISTDKDYTFKEDGIIKDTAYINDANIVSTKNYKNEDYVIGYFNPKLNFIKIIDIIKPVTGEITSYKNSNGTVVINGKTYDAISDYKLLDNFRENIEQLYKKNTFEITTDILNSKEFYIYNNIILSAGNSKKEYTNFDGDLIIPTNIKKPRIEFNPTSGEDEYYIYTWVDGDLKYVPVEVEDVYPSLLVDNKVSAEYAEQLCSFIIRDNKYVITSLAYGEDEDGEYIGMEKEDYSILNTDEEVQVIKLDKNVQMSKYIGYRYEIENFDNKVVITDNTKIIIRSYDKKENKYIYTKYNKSDFTEDIETTFDTVTYIVSNDTERKDRDNLVILYATVNGEFNFIPKANKDGYRIIHDVKVDQDDEGDYRYFYEVLNPYTGRIEEVMGADYASKISGLPEPLAKNTIVKLIDSKVKDSVGNISYNWLVEYDNDNELITIVDYDEKANTEETIKDLTEKCYFVDADTKVTVLTENNYRLINLEDITKDMIVTGKVLNEKTNKYETVKAPYPIAYVEVEDKKEYEYPVAKFIIIIATEDIEYIPCN